MTQTAQERAANTLQKLRLTAEQNFNATREITDDPLVQAICAYALGTLNKDIRLTVRGANGPAILIKNKRGQGYAASSDIKFRTLPVNELRQAAAALTPESAPELLARLGVLKIVSEILKVDPKTRIKLTDEATEHDAFCAKVWGFHRGDIVIDCMINAQPARINVEWSLDRQGRDHIGTTPLTTGKAYASVHWMGRPSEPFYVSGSSSGRYPVEHEPSSKIYGTKDEGIAALRKSLEMIYKLPAIEIKPPRNPKVQRPDAPAPAATPV